MTLEELDPVAFSILATIPENLPQAQYDVSSQLRILAVFARKLKMYDALVILTRVTDRYPPPA